MKRDKNNDFRARQFSPDKGAIASADSQQTYQPFMLLVTLILDKKALLCSEVIFRKVSRFIYLIVRVRFCVGRTNQTDRAFPCTWVSTPVTMQSNDSHPWCAAHPSRKYGATHCLLIVDNKIRTLANVFYYSIRTTTSRIIMISMMQGT